MIGTIPAAGGQSINMVADRNTAGISGIPQQFQPSVVYPGDECCTLYGDNGFSGNKLTLCLDNGSAKNYDLTQSGDAQILGSWWCGKGVSYKFCADSDDKCTNEKLNGGAGSGYNSVTG